MGSLLGKAKGFGLEPIDSIVDRATEGAISKCWRPLTVVVPCERRENEEGISMKCLITLIKE